MVGRRLLATVAVLTLLSACASSGPSVQLPELAGGLSVGNGAQVRVSPDGIAGGIDDVRLLQPMHHDRKALRKQLEQLHQDQVQKAGTSFSIDPDSVYVWLDVRMPFSLVRDVLADLDTVGFKRLHVVGRTSAGTVSATRFHTTRPKDTDGPDLSLLWGEETKKATERRKEVAEPLPKDERSTKQRLLKKLAENAGLLAALGHKPIKGVEVGTWDGNRYTAYKKDHCPAIPYSDDGKLDTKRLAAFAAGTCGRSGDAMAVGLGPQGETLWGEVASLARKASAPGCKIALFLERASRKPTGCGSEMKDIFGSAALGTKLSNSIGGLVGAKGTQIGSGGLGMRGSGLGGGGRGGGGTIGMGGLGGLGSKGRGGGSTGYGRGAGAFSTAKLLPGAVTLQGACDKTATTRVLRRYMNQLRYCYQRELVKKPTLGGTVQVKWTIDKHGRVPKATLEANLAAQPAVGQCVRLRFLRMRFPKPSNGGVCVASQPLVFKPGMTPKPKVKKASKP